MNSLGEQWRDRAEAARKQAARMTDPEEQRQILDIAEVYDYLGRYLDTKQASKPEGTRVRSLLRSGG
jgi:hypothetical protein